MAQTQSKNAVVRILHNLPKEISQNPRLIAGPLAFNIFTIIQREFIKKAKGKTDQFGVRWKPLAPSTIASRPLNQPDADVYAATFNRSLGQLSFRGVPHKLARQLAAQTARSSLLGKRNRRTLTSLKRGKNPPILILSGRLLQSLSPGNLTVGGHYTPRPEQIFTISGKRIMIGSKVPYLKYLDRERPVMPTRKADIKRIINEALRSKPMKKSILSTVKNWLNRWGIKV